MERAVEARRVVSRFQTRGGSQAVPYFRHREPSGADRFAVFQRDLRSIFSAGEGLSTQVAVGASEGLEHPSWIMCDNLVSIRKTDLSDYVDPCRERRFPISILR